jgi:D-lactate dehydrogenase
MHIFACDLEDWEKEKFKQLDNEHQVEFCTEKLTQGTAETAKETEVLSVFINSELSAELLRKLPRLKLIATRSTGVDHIDLDYCKEHDITVSNVPTYGDNTVAEHVFALLLNISHRLTESIDRTRRGDFSQVGLQGFDLQNKTFGVVGTGSIGAYVIGIARGFNMEVLAFDVKPDEQLRRKLGFEYVTMDTLLQDSDVISVHVPLTPKTHHLISEQQFRKMKKGVILINTSRGTTPSTPGRRWSVFSIPP